MAVLRADAEGARTDALESHPPVERERAGVDRPHAEQQPAAAAFARTVDVLKSKVLPTLGTDRVEGDTRICKVSIVGIGMRSHVGIASKMFRALAEEGINIQMISTSEIKTSVVIDEKYMELAVRALHRAFDLDQPAPEPSAA